jgi:uncharacterized membrane protein YphA (DoxX/SURF4 family)
MARLLNLHPKGAGGTDLALVGLRIAVSVVLIWGALTKLAAGERIVELAGRWEAAGLPQPQLLVSTSVGLQLILALMLLVGLFTRTVGVINGVNFALAATISGIFTSGAHWWPFALLIVLLLHFGMAGGGSFSIDAVRARRVGAGSLEDLMDSMGIRPNSSDGNYPGQS